jgi:hypothetical protein
MTDELDEAREVARTLYDGLQGILALIHKDEADPTVSFVGFKELVDEHPWLEDTDG